MIEELDTLNRGLEKLVEVRTAALRESEAQLKAQNLRFEAAVNNMSQALLMFDGDRRLVICNERYRRMYGLSREIVKPGCTLARSAGAPQGDRHLRRRHRRVHRADVRDACDAAPPWPRLVELPDGRTIAVLNRPMTDGGWVATHEDITERRRAEQQIAHMARHDALTDLPNRVLFRERLDEALDGVEPRRRARGALSRPRPFQGRQRHARPSDRRRAAQGWWPTGCADCVARNRHRRARRRRRIRHHADRHRRSRSTPPSLARRDRRSGARALRHRRPCRGRRHQHRHRARARTTASSRTSC